MNTTVGSVFKDGALYIYHTGWCLWISQLLSILLIVKCHSHINVGKYVNVQINSVYLHTI